MMQLIKGLILIIIVEFIFSNSLKSQYFKYNAIKSSSSSIGLAASDIDGDEDIDIISYKGSNLIWHKNSFGIGIFNEEYIISTDTPIDCLSTCDLDGDGDVDIIIATAKPSNHKIGWYENIDGTGTFSNLKIISTNVINTNCIYVSDIDGDNYMDVLSTSFSDDKIAWYKNLDGKGSFGNQRLISLDLDGPSEIFASDMDNDDDIDIICASSYYENKLVWFENTDGKGTFGEQKIISTNYKSSLNICDIDRDSDIDLFFVSLSDDKIMWYENTDGRGIFGYEHIISSGTEGNKFISCDIDNDDDIDLLSTSTSSVFVWYENTNGKGTFSLQQTIPTSSSTKGLIILTSDIDGDRDLDILTISVNYAKIGWYESIGEVFCSDINFYSNIIAPLSNPSNLRLPGRTLRFRLTTKNKYIKNILFAYGEISTENPYVTIIDNYGTFNNILVEETTQSEDYFEVRFSNNAPQNTPIRFSLTMKDEVIAETWESSFLVTTDGIEIDSLTAFNFYTNVEANEFNPNNYITKNVPIRLKLQSCINLISSYEHCPPIEKLEASIHTDETNVFFTKNKSNYQSIGKYSNYRSYWNEGEFEFINNQTPPDGEITFEVFYFDSITSVIYDTNSFTIPLIEYDWLNLDDDSNPDSRGNNNDTIESGEIIEIYPMIKNNSSAGFSNITGHLTTTSDSITIWHQKQGASHMVYNEYPFYDAPPHSSSIGGEQDFVFDCNYNNMQQIDFDLIVTATANTLEHGNIPMIFRIPFSENEEPDNTENKFISFTFSDQLGETTIDTIAHTIIIDVSQNSDISNLVANFTVSKEAKVFIGNVEQQSAITANNFTAPITYTIEAENGDKQDWIVTVNVSTVGITTNSHDKIEIYPNPFNSSINLTNIQNADQVAVLTLLGKEIASFKNDGDKSKTLLLQHIEPGIYILELQFFNGKNHVFKVVKCQ